MTWRRLNGLGVIVICLLWGVASFTGWVHSVVLVNHLSFAALVISFVAAWRADVPIKDEEKT